MTHLLDSYTFRHISTPLFFHSCQFFVLHTITLGPLDTSGANTGITLLPHHIPVGGFCCSYPNTLKQQEDDRHYKDTFAASVGSLLILFTNPCPKKLPSSPWNDADVLYFSLQSLSFPTGTVRGSNALV